MFALVKTYGKRFSRQVACFVHVLHLPRKCIWQVKFLLTLHLFALLQTDGKSFKASCSPCSGFSFATKVHWQVKSGVRNVAFCLPYCKINGIKRSTQLAHTAIVATSTAILLPLVRFKSWQKKQHDFEQLRLNLQRHAKYYQNFSTKKQPEKVAFVFVYKSLYCTNSTPASLMRCAANSSG